MHLHAQIYIDTGTYMYMCIIHAISFVNLYVYYIIMLLYMRSYTNIN